MEQKKLTLEQTQELFDYLIGEYIPEQYLFVPPKLDIEKAWDVIYLMQEHFKIIPDTYEKCYYCNEIFNTENSGHYCDCADCEQIKSCEEYHRQSYEDIKKKLEGKFFCCQECEHNFLIEESKDDF